MSNELSTQILRLLSELNNLSAEAKKTFKEKQTNQLQDVEVDRMKVNVEASKYSVEYMKKFQYRDPES